MEPSRLTLTRLTDELTCIASYFCWLSKISNYLPPEGAVGVVKT